MVKLIRSSGLTSLCGEGDALPLRGSASNGKNGGIPDKI